MASFFFQVVFIIGLAENIENPSMKYCFFYSVFYLGIISTLTDACYRYLQFVYDSDRFNLDLNFSLDTQANYDIFRHISISKSEKE